MRTRNPRLSHWFATAVLASLSGAALSQPATSPAPNMRGDGPAPTAKPFSMTRSHPALDAIVARNAEAELLASGFGLNEGPVWVPEGNSGYLLVGGLLDNVIYKISADKEVSVFMEQAGYSGTDVSNTGTQTRSGRSHVLLIGPSCASLDSQGRLIWCADNDRTVMRLEKDGTRTVLSAGAPDGKRFSGPNDIVVARDDAVYLTDNDFGLRGAGRSPDKQMPNGIWRIKDGVSTLVLGAEALGGIPNGIVLSPDERYLYLSALQKMMRYEVRPDGSLGAGSLFTEGPGIGDGMKVDVDGNVYSDEWRRPRRRPHNRSERHVAGLLEFADRRRRAEAADLRDERRVRRRGRQELVRHRLRRCVPDSTQGRRSDAGAETLAPRSRRTQCIGHTLSRSRSRRLACPRTRWRRAPQRRAPARSLQAPASPSSG